MVLTRFAKTHATTVLVRFAELARKVSTMVLTRFAKTRAKTVLVRFAELANGSNYDGKRTGIRPKRTGMVLTARFLGMRKNFAKRTEISRKEARLRKKNVQRQDSAQQ